MDTKQPRSGSAAALKALELADKQIADLKKLFLPHEPHLLTVPTDHPFRETSSYEYRGTPFANHEVRHLQHMTMISESQRGVARAEGDWQARIESRSPASLAARSSTTTPSHAKEMKIPSKKISIADYKNFKLTGAKPPPRAMEDSKQNGASVAKPEKARDTKISTLSHGKTNPSMTNGHSQSKSANLTAQPAKIPQIREPPKHQLPPRPKSPPRKTYDVKPSEPKKRPIESGDGRQPEKRTKIDTSRDTPKASQTPSRDSPQARKGMTKPTNKPIPLPERLSPLPEDLFNIGSGSKTSTPKPSDQDTIVVRAQKSRAKSPSSASSRTSRSPSPLRPLPPMLPLALHPALDREMDRLSEKKARKDASHTGTPDQSAEKTASRNTVGARYEEVRRPDVPGVARKTITPKVGHPPKRPQGESSKRPPSTKDTLVVKLKYKRRRVKDIQRILGIQAKPSKEFLVLERQRKARLNPSYDDDPEDEIPSSAVVSKPTLSKKRPSDSTEVAAEPAPKRAKLPDVDVAKAKTSLEPPFKSPAPSGPSQKNILATPKRGDAMKSVAMRRVDSNDGNARTPQTMATSTPASAEKPRPNGEQRHPVDERLFGEFQKLNDHSLKLKRKMDEILQIKTKGMDSLTEGQRKVGFAVALECVAMYMTSFAAKDRASKSRSATSWEGGLKLWSWLESLVQNMPIYHALSVQLGAILREELGRCYLETLLAGNRDPNFLKILGDNEVRRDQCWKEVRRVQSDLRELHAPDILGPWTTTTDAATYIRSVLELYAKKEKTGWKPFTP